eukprot:TRINITY_DN15801_c0_g1_i1.p1 TRINITY_DN15801_c0_g1~~TRINITY_DN15801_c0_g1_i1.p1  ORF type:complete len:292 (-),score=57.14 TRINITY_DN15801_c0_g1_i1:216-1091(-)
MALEFAGRVAIVTGAGNGLGKEYAKLLASRGAKVVVNDLGGSLTGTGGSTSAADDVVAEIMAAQGEAVANYDSVTSGSKIVQSAVDAFGRVDVVVNNAGILRDVSFKKMTDEDWDLVYEVHLKGVYSVTRAAWSYMIKQGYGRIVNVSSPAGLYGNFGQVNYSTMKRAVVGFTMALAKEGNRSNIKANVIAPLGATRMLETVMSKDVLQKLPTSSIAQVVAYLAHENCRSTGEVYETAGNVVTKLRWQRSAGVKFQDGFTSQDVADKYDEISDFEAGSDYPSDIFSMTSRL